MLKPSELPVSSALFDIEEYSSPKFAYSVDYPKNILIPQGESDPIDGQRFESTDKTFKMTVWGAQNGLDYNLTNECRFRIESEKAHHPFQVTSKVVKDGWYMFSGFAGSNIIYQKAFLKDSILRTLNLEYPTSDKKKFDPVVELIVASFKANSMLK